MSTRSRLSGLTGGEQQVDEAGPLGLVPAQGEDLLELVHHDPALRLVLGRGQQMPVRGGGPVARSEDPQHRRAAPAPRSPPAAAGISPARSREDLPLPDAPNTTANRCSAHQLAQLVDQPVPAEEQVTVGRLEAGEAPVRRRRVLVGLLVHADLRGLRLGLLPPRLPLPGSPPQARTYPWTHGQRRQPFARPPPGTASSPRSPAAWAMVRYDGLPAALRSSRSSWARRCTGPAAGSTGLSGRPTKPSPFLWQYVAMAVRVCVRTRLSPYVAVWLAKTPFRAANVRTAPLGREPFPDVTSAVDNGDETARQTIQCCPRG